MKELTYYAKKSGEKNIAEIFAFEYFRIFFQVKFKAWVVVFDTANAIAIGRLAYFFL